MGFSIDPVDLIGSAVSDIVKTSIIIGMPSPTAKIPNFILATIPDERAQGSVTLASLQVTAGDYLMKGAINSGVYTMTVVLSDYDPLPTTWLSAVATALQQLSNVGNSIANFGAILPNLSSLTTNFVRSQLSVLYQMKNNVMPIIILNSYITLGSISQTHPNLQSNWYIEDVSSIKEESEGGLVVDISLRELLTKRDSSLSKKNIIANIAGVVTGGLVGTNIL